VIKNFFALLVSAYCLHAAESRVQFDPGATRVEYTLGTTFHTVHGTFRFKSGSVRFDPAGGKASGLLSVDATSGQSGDQARDNRMHKDILQTSKYPDITFAPDSIDGAVKLDGDSQVMVRGTFGIHGGQHEITMPAQVHISNGEVSLTSSFDIPYMEWGIKNPSTLIFRVNKTVKIDIQAAGKLTPE
jgi:polyisoprenoid-binding protein YceI